MTGVVMAAAGASGRKIFLSGPLSTTAASPITSATRTFIGGGEVEFETVFTDGGTPEYSHNGGGWTTITEGATLAIADSDTIAVRVTLGPGATEASFFLKNNNPGVGNETIEFVALIKV